MRSTVVAALSLAASAKLATSAPAPVRAPVVTFPLFGDADLLQLTPVSQSNEHVREKRAIHGSHAVKFGLTEKHRQWPRTTAKRLGKRQATDDESELLNFEDTRYIATINIAGEVLDVILDTGSTDTFVYSVQPTPLAGYPADQLPPLFSNSSAVGVTDTGLTYEAEYGSGNGITETLGAIQLADVMLNGTDLQATNLTFANLYQSSAATGASGLLGLGFPLNGVIWLQFIADYYNRTGEALPANQSAEYWPIVPLLYHEGKIPNALFSVEVDRDPENSTADSSSSAATFASQYTDGGTLTLGDYPTGMSESSFTFSPVPYVRFNELGQARGLPAATGNRWTTPLEAIYFNGQLLTNTTMQSDIESDGGVFFTLIDTGNPSTGLPSDVISQITNAWAANPSNTVADCSMQFDLVLQFSGKNFTMAKEDFLVPSEDALDSLGFGGMATTGCQFQAQPNDPTPDEVGPQTSITYTLGAPFLRNVVSVFDYGSLTNAAQDPPRIGLAARSQ